MSDILNEITPLGDKDCFYLIDRLKDSFNYPLHRHDEFELNFVSNCAGARRIAGDSVEELPSFDLTLVGNGIEHAWEQHNCTSGPIREITIQFSRELFGSVFLGKTQLTSIRRMLDDASKGVTFGLMTIMRIFGRLERLTHLDNDFYRVIEFITILYELSISQDYRILASGSFTHTTDGSEARAIERVKRYIDRNYREEIRLEKLASLAGMTPTSFSRYFKLTTGRSVSDYIIDIRLGMASRSLVDTANTITEICYDSGFNNISHFNRLFKKKKGCTPKEFREMYKRTRRIV